MIAMKVKTNWTEQVNISHSMWKKKSKNIWRLDTSIRWLLVCSINIYFLIMWFVEYVFSERFADLSGRDSAASNTVSENKSRTECPCICKLCTFISRFVITLGNASAVCSIVITENNIGYSSHSPLKSVQANAAVEKKLSIPAEYEGAVTSEWIQKMVLDSVVQKQQQQILQLQQQVHTLNEHTVKYQHHSCKYPPLSTTVVFKPVILLVILTTQLAWKATTSSSAMAHHWRLCNRNWPPWRQNKSLTKT